MKVKRITKIPNEDVYNMYVDKHNNFAVNGGLIVHNCDSLRYFAIMRQGVSAPPPQEIPYEEYTEFEDYNELEDDGFW